MIEKTKRQTVKDMRRERERQMFVRQQSTTTTDKQTSIFLPFLSIFLAFFHTIIVIIIIMKSEIERKRVRERDTGRNRPLA